MNKMKKEDIVFYGIVFLLFLIILFFLGIGFDDNYFCKTFIDGNLSVTKCLFPLGVN